MKQRFDPIRLHFGGCPASNGSIAVGDRGRRYLINLGTFLARQHPKGVDHDFCATAEAHHKALELTRTLALDVKYWPTADPTAIEGSREQRMNAYRDVRDQLLQRIRTRFFPAPERATNAPKPALTSCRMALIR